MKLEAEQLEVDMLIMTDDGAARVTWIGEQSEKYQPIAYRLADGREIMAGETRYWDEFEIIHKM